MKDAIRRNLLETVQASWKDFFIFAFICEGGWALWWNESFNPFDVLAMTGLWALIAWALRISLTRTVTKNRDAAGSPRS